MIIPHPEVDLNGSLAEKLRTQQSEQQNYDEPPPYVGPESQEGASSSSSVPAPVRANSLFESVGQQQVNNVFLFSKHNAINGSYILNPELPDTISPTLRGCRGPLDKQNRKLIGRDRTPNAMFHTRHGAITLNLATAGNTEAVTRTHVQASSRHGKVHCNIFSLQPNKHICLEVGTRHGHIVVFLPQNFQGALRIRSRRGSVNFLPAFAHAARVVEGNDSSALVLFGQKPEPVTDLDSDEVDLCLLTTRHGRITVGISGVDHYDPSVETSPFLKTLGSLSMLLLGDVRYTKIKQVISRFEQ
ncbi:hypothetical protein K474DRAFT_653666 [Panus rudis PR-1116 ss-1]|nr:hypothetical protein K474DRAFT_653666 [Panus rudis PR-1116 ss-1]